MDGVDQILAADVKMTPISGGLAPKTRRPHPVVMGALRTSSILLRGGGLERPFSVDLGFGDELICQKVFCAFCVCLACSEAGWEVLCPACFLPA